MLGAHKASHLIFSPPERGLKKGEGWRCTNDIHQDAKRPSKADGEVERLVDARRRQITDN
jgi:hypothetical protein